MQAPLIINADFGRTALVMRVILIASDSFHQSHNPGPYQITAKLW